MTVVRKDEDRTGASFRFLNGRFDVKVSAAETGGGFCVIDTIRSEPGGPPAHVHHDQEEWFLVTEGRFNFLVGDDRFELGPGDSILGPRGLPHAFSNTTPTGRLIVMFQPAGSMEAFFHEGSRRGKMSPEAFAELSAQHGMKVVGPPLPQEHG